MRCSSCDRVVTTEGDEHVCGTVTPGHAGRARAAASAAITAHFDAGARSASAANAHRDDGARTRESSEDPRPHDP
jgi:hypothetical protein